MVKLVNEIMEEIKCIEEQGLSSSNLEVLDKLADVANDLIKLEEKTQPQEVEDMRYNYNDGGYNRSYRGGGGSYGRRGGNYGHFDERLYDRLDRISEGMDDYLYGRDRYRDNGGQDRMQEGLEKVMYGICTLVESIVDFAETPEEKEIVRKHINKMSNI